MRDPWIDYFVAAGLVTVLWTQASIDGTRGAHVTILASDHGLAVWETGDRPFRAEPFCLETGSISGWSRYWPATTVWFRGQGDRGQPNPDGLNHFVFLPHPFLFQMSQPKGRHSRVGKCLSLGCRWSPDRTLPCPTCLMAAPLWCGLGMPFPKQSWY